MRVVLTTNFDRLVERALEEAGVSPQVISRPEAVVGMTPLPHARATVVKLHGDYADLQSRNAEGHPCPDCCLSSEGGRTSRDGRRSSTAELRREGCRGR